MTIAAGLGDLRSDAIAFLGAVRDGDDRAVELASAFAERTLVVSGARLALEVLEGGPLSVTRAIRLTELVLALVEACEAPDVARGAS